MVLDWIHRAEMVPPDAYEQQHLQAPATTVNGGHMSRCPAYGVEPMADGCRLTYGGNSLQPKQHSKGQLVKRAVRRLVERSGYEVYRVGTLERERARSETVVRQMTALVEQDLFSLPPAAGREDLLCELVGTDPVEALFLLAALHAGLARDGDVCEFGVAQGATSALIANELRVHAPERLLWLYDSFEGLPKPTERDLLVDDPLGLGSMSAYEGRFAEPRSAVEGRLTSVGWPFERTRIIEGFFTDATPEADLPLQVSFAYVDFDLYQPIADVLTKLEPRTRPGARIMVDDYGYLSAGAKEAVDEFATKHQDSWTLEVGPDYCHFATFHRVA
jgi:O-methyltransferase